MEESSAEASPTKPLWRRIADFPLMAMLVAVALFVLVRWRLAREERLEEAVPV